MKRWLLLSLAAVVAACGGEDDTRARADASVVDAAVSDAGGRDASVFDAGAGDASVPDAGAPDAGPVAQPLPPTAVGEWAWVPIDGSECASGARAGLGVNRATGGEDLFIYLQSGGACWNQGTCVPSMLEYGPVCSYGTTCTYEALGGRLPSSRHVTTDDPFPADGGGAFGPELAYIRASPALDRARAGNPFRDATFIFVPYCTGDFHAGTSFADFPWRESESEPVQQRRVRFSGAKNMAVYLSRLAATFPGVRRVWLTGSSAGGYGAVLNYQRTLEAFPDAEVHLLADASPMLPTPRWETWRDLWGVELPPGCAGCAAGLDGWVPWLASLAPQRRQGLLASQGDVVISWFLYAPPGPDGLAHPPRDVYAQHLEGLEDACDATDNSKYYVVPGTGHGLWPDYGRPTREGMTAFIDAWATGGAAFSSQR